jgi:DNA repair protein RecO (recombination protein O)
VAEFSVTGIVLRRRDSGESDRRLTLLTRELGKIDVIAKGSRKGASRLAGVTEPLSVATFGLAMGKKNAFVTQAQATSTYRKLRTDYDRLSFSLALVEIFAAVVPFEEPIVEIYSLLERGLREIEAGEKPIVASVWVQVALLRLSGVLPLFQSCAICDTPSQFEEAFLSPSAGGCVCQLHVAGHSDRFIVRHEVLVGLGRMAELDEPPKHLKFSYQCFTALVPFWRSFAEMALPANDALIRHLHETRLAGESEFR